MQFEIGKGVQGDIRPVQPTSPSVCVRPQQEELCIAELGLASAGVACLMFLFFYGIIDLVGLHRWAFPFAVIGTNALAAYLSSSVARLGQITGIFTRAAAPYLGDADALVHAMLLLAVEWAILYRLYRRRIFLSA